MKNKMKNNGFTLIELMVTLAVATILITVAVPGFRTMIQNNRASTQSNELLSALMLARNEAIKRGVNVSMCSSDDQTNCKAASGTDWKDGWIVFVDINGDGTFTDVSIAGDTTTLCNVDTNNELIEDCRLRVWDELKGGPTLTASSSNIQYQGSGLVAAATTFTLTMPDCKGEQVRRINVNATGRARVTPAPCP